MIRGFTDQLTFQRIGRLRRLLRLVLITASTLLACSSAAAQEPQSPRIIARGQQTTPEQQPEQQPQQQAEQQPDAPNDPSRLLRQRLETLTVQLTDADLEEADRQQILNLLTQATQELDLSDRLRQENSDLKQQADSLTARAETMRKPPVLENMTAPESMSVEELEDAVATEKVRLESEVQTLEKVRAENEDSASARQKAQERVDTREQEVAAAVQRIKEVPTDSGRIQDTVASLAAEASRLKAEADYDLARTSLALLEAQLSLNLPTLQVSHQEEVVKLYTERLRELTAQLDQRRQDSSRQELERARQSEDQLAGIENTQIRALGELRIELATENDQLAQHRLPRWRAVLERRRSELQQLKESSRKIRNRVEEFGTDTTLGRELLHFGTELPSIAELQKEMNEIDQLTSGWRLRSLEYSEARDQIAAVSDQTRKEATEAEIEILDGVTEVLGQLEENNNALFAVLGDVNGEDQLTISFIEDWKAFSSEHALWLRSHEPLTSDQIREALPSVREMGQSLFSSLTSFFSAAGVSVWALILPAGVAILVLLAVQNRAKKRLQRHGDLATQSTCMSMRPTMLALLLSIGMAAEWPLILMLIGSVLRAQSAGTAVALGQSLIQLGGIGLWLNFFRQVLRPGGLAFCHLNWNPVVCDRLRRWLRLVLLVVAFPMFFFLLARRIPDATDTLDRVLFMVLMVCSTLVLARLFLPISNQFVQALVSRWSLLRSWRFIWIALVLVTPLILAGLSATGYYHTALVLWDRLGWTVVSGTGIILTWSLVLRWLSINHRAMRLALARERAQQRDQQEETSEVDLAMSPATQASELIVFGTQARQLIRNAVILVTVGCAWAIWFDTLPALRVLERQTVWNVTEQVTEQVTTENDETVETVRTQTRPVTVVSLLLVLFVASATWIGVRQLPGLIEVILLRRQQFDAGLRYTITTVVRYVMLVAGCTICFGLLGLRWSQVQWLVAGLSVGLGFGLQEVFANFVSGIIILVERPIRIGDVVTIDGVSGVVSRIQIRATSITDWDRREYIVPNRELVTGKLLNWTLSDATNRIMISVGIGYSSDPEKARSTMLRIATEHPNVMDDPAPLATFENFGDSSLDLVLRAYLPDLDNRLATITDLHTQIHKAFEEEGIVIPFPQREVRML